MLTDYISPGNRVELKATGKVWMDEDVRTKYLGSGFVLKRSKSVERARAEVEHEK